jgi:predicted ATPase
MSLHCTSLTYTPPRGLAGFPFTVPVIQSLRELKFTAPVTFFVGENGSGKSTLLEAMAIAARSVTVGSADAHTDETLKSVRALARHLRLVWRKRTHKGFFLRAEDYFGYARRLNKMREELEGEMKTVDEDYTKAGRSEQAKGLAKMAYAGQLDALRRSYGEGLDARSHGESFLAFFQARFVPGGLYLLDEPEAPLSPARQLALLAALKLMVEQDSQFIIATHSPILMAFPEAAILNFDSDPVQPVDYKDLEHVNFTKAFLNNPKIYLKHL